ncbi:MAG TPA: NAD(+)/NADH kinase [Epulopiscium sp.]|nr:NAD(+)/NADH kinase [Candidatus Epulonipiscium sp.]
MKRIGIIPNIIKDQGLVMTKQVIKWFEDHHFTIMVTPDIAKLLERSNLESTEEELFKTSDCIVVLGGDGTLLGVAQKAAVEAVPIIGVNLGRLGFLTDIEKETALASFEKLVTEDYYIEERLMLEVQIISESSEIQTFIALNDISITRDSYSRMIDYSIHINGQYADVYPADGIIVATPTGSTAYSLSAGGPIVDPKANIMVITPICPHTIYSRSIIVSEQDTIDILIPDLQGGSVGVSIDGKKVYSIEPKDIIRVSKSHFTSRLLKISDHTFYDILRNKIVERRPGVREY